MNYEEVVKALEICIKAIEEDQSCKGCPLLEFSRNYEECQTELIKQALNLINRQQEEIEFLDEEISEERHENMCLNATIERLNEEIVSLKFPYKQQVEVSKELEARIKSEARKEFAMRFISLIGGYELSGTTPYKIIARAEKDIVELATEWDSEDSPIEMETDE